jgi:flagellar basal-body rod modification protein FlgD
MSVIPVTAASTPPGTTTPAPVTGGSTSGSGGSVVDTQLIGDNFNTFLTLLTTQLKNQNPLDPMDTNQFTQQLVQFAQVEQQMKSNTQLQTLISLQQSAQSTAALNYVGHNVVVDGSNGSLSGGQATWNLNVSKPAAATITVQDSTGATVYTATGSLQPGGQQFVWNGIGSDGVQRLDGVYTITAVASDASKQNVPVSIELQGKVNSVDLTQNPPVLSIAGQTYTMDKIKRILSSN